VTSSLIVPVLAASVVGSLHCAGMCGGFVAFYSGADGSSAKRSIGHVAYNLGRLFVYLTLGAIGGAIGVAVDLAGESAGIGRIAALVAGSLMLVWGLSLLLRSAGVRWPKLRLPAELERRVSGSIARLRSRPLVVRAGLLGLSSALLPCGWLYAFVVTASGTGSVHAGMAVMGAFWLGTVPALLGLGVGAQRLSARIRRHVPVVTAIALLVVGIAGVLGRVNVPALAAASARNAIVSSRAGSAPERHAGPPIPGKPCCHTR
jgi:uncharacterized protein